MKVGRRTQDNQGKTWLDNILINNALDKKLTGAGMGELKPCPFCGNPAKIIHKSSLRYIEPEKKVYHCSNRACIGTELCADFDDWNTRHPPQAYWEKRRLLTK